MENFIDILSRLIIATITFIAPLMIFLFGIIHEGITLKINTIKIRKKTLLDEAYSQMGQDQDEENRAKVIATTNKKLNSNWDKICFWFTNPQNQLVIIFCSLLLSLGFLMWNYLIKDNVWGMRESCSWIAIIKLCLLSYSIAIIFIICFVVNVLKLKTNIDKNKS